MDLDQTDIDVLFKQLAQLRKERAAVVAALMNLNVTPDRACYDALEVLGLMPRAVK